MTRLCALFMTRHGLPVFNPQAADLLLFLECLAASGYVAKSIRSHLTAIARMHRERSITWQAPHEFAIQTHLAGLDKTLAHRVQQAPVLMPETMELLIAHLARKRGHEPYAFAFMLAYTTFIRQANLAPPSSTAFNRRRHTQRSDIIATSQGLGLTVFWTKTRQKSRAPDVIPIPRLRDSIVCPTTWWFRYKAATRGANPHGPLLVHPERQGDTLHFRPITLNFLRAVFRSLLAEAEVTQRYTLHSLRRGGSLVCYREGATLPDLMQHGTWASDAIWNYLAKDAVYSSSVMAAWDSLARRRVLGQTSSSRMMAGCTTEEGFPLEGAAPGMGDGSAPTGRQ